MRYPIGIQRLGNIRKVGTVWWLMRLGILLAAVVLTAGCGSGSGDEPGSPTPGPSPVSPGSGSGSGSGTTPEPEPEVESGEPIAFSARQQEDQEVTRAEVPLESKVESFIVYGYKNKGEGYSSVQTVFPGYVVEWKGNANSSTTNTDGWDYLNLRSGGQDQTIKYWDMSATAYRFIGVAKDKGDYTEEVVTEGVLPNEYRISFDVNATTQAGVDAVPYFSTLWFSNNNDEQYPGRQFGKPVKLLFQKPFARVRFMFTQSYPDAVLMLEDKIFFPKVRQPIVNKCHLTVIYPLKGNNTVESYDIDPSSVDGISEFDEDYSDTNKRWYNVYAPQSLGVFTLSVKINGVEKTVDVPAEYMDWLPGYEYTYVFKITDQGGIEIDLVESAFNEWYEMKGNTAVFNW